MSDNAMIWGGTTSSDDRLWATIAHLSLYVAPFIGPILIYFLCGNKVYIKYHAAQALFMHVVAVVLGGIGVWFCGLGLVFALLPIYGAYLAMSGAWNGYPLISGIGR